MLTTSIESILFAAAKPIAREQLKKQFSITDDVLDSALSDIRLRYNSPISGIRGVNCGLILRNLLIRGYIEETQDKVRLQSVFAVSVDFLRKLGLVHIEELPEYESFHNNESIDELLNKIQEQSVV